MDRLALGRLLVCGLVCCVLQVTGRLVLELLLGLNPSRCRGWTARVWPPSDNSAEGGKRKG